MFTQYFFYILVLAFVGQTPSFAPEIRAQMEVQTAELRAILQKSQKLPLERVELKPMSPQPGWEMGLPNFCSTTDIAFAPNGHLFISDGYANARILEYTPDGKKVREWRSRGTRPGQFYIPHSIQIDENNIIYVADRENGRISAV